MLPRHMSGPCPRGPSGPTLPGRGRTLPAQVPLLPGLAQHALSVQAALSRAQVALALPSLPQLSQTTVNLDQQLNVNYRRYQFR